MIKYYAIFLFFSNAVTLRRDKYTVYIIVSAIYDYFIPMCEIIFKIMLVVLLTYALFLFFIFIIRNIKITITVIMYLYLLLNYIIECIFKDISIFTIVIVAFLSLLSLYFLLRKCKCSTNYNNKISYPERLLVFMHYISNNGLCVIMLFISIYLIKYCINTELMLYNNTAYNLFISFSLLLPTFILSRILRKSYIIYIAMPYIPLYILLYYQFTLKSNYIVRVEDISIFAFIYFVLCIPFIITTDLVNASYLYTSDFKSTHDNSVYTSYCYDDTVVPRDSVFDSSVLETLNVEQSFTKNELILASEITEDNLEWGDFTDNMRFDHIDGEKVFRTNNSYYYYESYLKRKFTTFINSKRLPEIPNSHTWNTGSNNGVFGCLSSNRGVISSLKDYENNKTSESYVDQFVITTLTNYFKSEEGYSFSPQAKESSDLRGKIDIRLNFDGETRLIIENKIDCKTSWLDAIDQAKNYCSNDSDLEKLFVLIFKGTKFSFFLYDKDFHTDNNFGLKHPKYQDMLGIAVSDKGLYLLPQSNNYHPQMVVYDSHIESTPTNRIATEAIFGYISHYKQNYCDNSSLLPMGSRTRLGSLGDCRPIASKGTSFLGIHFDGGFNRTI